MISSGSFRVMSVTTMATVFPGFHQIPQPGGTNGAVEAFLNRPLYLGHRGKLPRLHPLDRNGSGIYVIVFFPKGIGYCFIIPLFL